jgi:type III secretory pathway component EscR
MTDSALTFTPRTCAGLFRRTASKVPITPSEDTKMKRFLILSALVLSTTLIGPVIAQSRAPQEKRYYDRNGKDYHAWNNNEDRAYRSYLTEQHRDYREFNRVNRSQQQQYFTWRHQHPDNTLFKVEIR